MNRTIPDSRQGGFTLLEFLGGAVLAIIAFSMMANFMNSGLTASRQTSYLTRLDARASRALAEIHRELAFAGALHIQPRYSAPLCSSSLQYRRAIGFSGGEVQWGPPCVIELQASPSDPIDGVDNDDNGLIDEGRVVLRVDPGTASEQLRVLVRGVARLLEGETLNSCDDNGNSLADEPGLCFHFEGDAIHIRLTLQLSGAGDAVYTHTVQTVVTPKN